jgi:hypothetical protein
MPLFYVLLVCPFFASCIDCHLISKIHASCMHAKVNCYNNMVLLQHVNPLGCYEYIGNCVQVVTRSAEAGVDS